LVPAVGSACYDEVVAAMYDVRNDREVYKAQGLDVWSSFEEVQDFLQSTGRFKSECGKSCGCQTAHSGSACYKSVAYAFNEGYAQHPEWYTGLKADSSFEDFQSHLWKWVDEANCSRPCAASGWRESPSLFCWSLARGSGYEVEVMKAQLVAGAGIFRCDGFAVMSEEDWTVGHGPGGRLGEVKTTSFKGADVGVSKDGTAGNAEQFMQAWRAVLKSTTVLKFDWTIKADPDAVIIADRLRTHLKEQTGRRVFVRNCNSHPENPDFPMMYGSLEALSREALVHFKDGLERCIHGLAWGTWGEDVFMSKCLTFLDVDPIDDFSISSDGVCAGVDCYDTYSAAFHPFKGAAEWTDCWNMATANLGGPPPPLP